MFVGLLEHNQRLKSTDLQIILRERYEEVYGIVNHSALANNPSESAFSLVTLNNNEDIYGNDIQKERARKFVNYRIPHYWNMSYKDFINLPKATCDMIFELTEEFIKEEKPTLAGIEKELGM